MEEQRINLKPALTASGLIIVLMLMLSAWAWVQSPPDQKIPVHWNFSGQVDRYGGKAEGLLGMPLVVLFLVGLFAMITRIEPRRMNLQRSMKAYTTMWIASLIVMLAIHIVGVLSVLGWKIDFNSVMPALTGLVFIVTGNYMGKIRSNFFSGARTPWTLSSDLSWSKTNRLGGKLFVVLGAIMIVTGFMKNPSLWLMMMSELILIGVIVIPYSYLVWKSDPDRPGAKAGAKSGVDWMAPVSYLLVLLLAVVILFTGRSVQHAKGTITTKAQYLVSNMARGDFASATKDFDATMKTVLPAEKLSQSWSQVTAQIGAFKSCAGSREAQEAGFQTVHVTCQFEKGRWDIKVVFDKDGKISGLWGSPAPGRSAQHSKGIITTKAQYLVSHMAKGDFASATKDFDATMKTVLPAEKLGQSWSQVTALIGAFKSCAGSREAQEAGFQTVHVTCQFEKGRWDIKVVFDKDGKISGLLGTPTQ